MMMFFMYKSVYEENKHEWNSLRIIGDFFNETMYNYTETVSVKKTCL